MKGVVVKCPASGEPVRLMPGSMALEYYEAAQKGDFGTKGNPGPGSFYRQHMIDLHTKWLKEQGK